MDERSFHTSSRQRHYDRYVSKEQFRKECDHGEETKMDPILHSLIDATRNADYDSVKVLIEYCSAEQITGTYVSRFYDNDDKDFGFFTLLSVSACDCWKILELVIDFFSNTISASESYFALHQAYKHGQMKCIEMLFNKFPHHIHEMDSDGFFPIHYAVQNGNFEVVDALIRAGADVNAILSHNIQDKDNRVRRKQGFTPLYMAADNGHLDIVTLVLSNGADPTIVNSWGTKNPLAAAAANGYLEIVKTLVDFTPWEGRHEAIRLAIPSLRNDCLGFLLSKGFSLPSLENGPRIMLFWTNKFQKDVSRTVKILVENGIPIFRLPDLFWLCVTPNKLHLLHINTLKTFLDFGWLESLWIKSPNVDTLVESGFKARVPLYEYGESDVKMNKIRANFALFQKYYPFVRFSEDSLQPPYNILDECFTPVVPQLREMCRWTIRCQIVSKYGIASHSLLQQLPLPKPLKDYLKYSYGRLI